MDTTKKKHDGKNGWQAIVGRIRRRRRRRREKEEEKGGGSGRSSGSGSRRRRRRSRKWKTEVGEMLSKGNDQGLKSSEKSPRNRHM